MTAWGVLAILAAFVPGAVFTWSFETQAGQADALWDRLLRLVSASAATWIVLAIPLGALWGWLGPGGGPFAFGISLAVSLLALVALPAWVGQLAGRAVAGTLERAARGRGAAGRGQVQVGRFLQRLPLLAAARPPRTAWDRAFAPGAAYRVELELRNGERLRGLYTEGACAGRVGRDGRADLYVRLLAADQGAEDDATVAATDEWLLLGRDEIAQLRLVPIESPPAAEPPPAPEADKEAAETGPAGQPDETAAEGRDQPAPADQDGGAAENVEARPPADDDTRALERPDEDTSELRRPD